MDQIAETQLHGDIITADLSNQLINSVGEDTDFQKIHYLDLTHNYFTSCLSIVEILKSFPQLQTLNLNQNPLQPIETFPYLFSSLQVFN